MPIIHLMTIELTGTPSVTTCAPPHEATRHLCAPSIATAISDVRSFADRMQIKHCRMQAWVDLTQDPNSGLNVSTARRQLAHLQSFLQSVKEPYRSRCVDCIEKIASPTPQTLEENGFFVRKLMQLQHHPDLQEKLDALISDRYWLEPHGAPALFKKWDRDTHTLNLHPALNENLRGQDADTVHRYDAALKLLCIIDPEVRAFVHTIPLPPESYERALLRRQLSQQKFMTFGDATMTHWNASGFEGDLLLTQRKWDDMAFGGALGTRTRPIPLADALSVPTAEWKTLDDLQRLEERCDPRVPGIVSALHTAARKNGFHVKGDFFDSFGRDLLGLDDRIFWKIDDSASQNGTYYGTHGVTIPIAAIPDAFVSLGDDVMINFQNRLEALGQYQNGLLSLAQFRELVLDHTTMATDGTPSLTIPAVPLFLTNDNRIEIQTRGCLALSCT